MSTTKQIIRFPRVKQLTGYSRSTIDRLEKKGCFPKRFLMGSNSVGWYLDEVSEWVSTPRPRGFLANTKHPDKEEMFAEMAPADVLR